MIAPTVIIDSREKLPFSFSKNVHTTVAALRVGDYSLVGAENSLAIERKSLADLLSSITHNRVRFEKELCQLRAFRFACLLVESTWPIIMMKQYSQDVSPNSIIGSLMSFKVRYNVSVLMADDHDTAGILCERILMNYARSVEREYRLIAKGSAEEAA